MSETLLEDGRITGPRGAKAFKKWTPKKWKPEYEIVVSLSCTGLSNEEVGKRTGYGKQQVSNIINTPQGQKLIQIITERLHKANAINVTERVERLQQAALKHVEYILDTPTDQFKNPLAIFDRSLAFLKSTSGGKFVSDTGNTTNNVVNANIANAMILSPEAKNLLTEGLDKANQVKVIHDGSIGHNNTGPGKPDGQGTP